MRIPIIHSLKLLLRRWSLTVRMARCAIKRMLLRTEVRPDLRLCESRRHGQTRFSRCGCIQIRDLSPLARNGSRVIQHLLQFSLTILLLFCMVTLDAHERVAGIRTHMIVLFLERDLFAYLDRHRGGGRGKRNAEREAERAERTREARSEQRKGARG